MCEKARSLMKATHTHIKSLSCPRWFYIHKDWYTAFRGSIHQKLYRLVRVIQYIIPCCYHAANIMASSWECVTSEAYIIMICVQSYMSRILLTALKCAIHGPVSIQPERFPVYKYNSCILVVRPANRKYLKLHFWLLCGFSSYAWFTGSSPKTVQARWQLVLCFCVLGDLEVMKQKDWNNQKNRHSIYCLSSWCISSAEKILITRRKDSKIPSTN